MMLPIVMEYNAECTGEKYREIARAMGVKGVDDMSVEEYRKAAVDAVRQLSTDVGIRRSWMPSGKKTSSSLQSPRMQMRAHLEIRRMPVLRI